MIPIRDTIRARRWPVVNYALIALCAWAFWRELAAGSDIDVLIEGHALTPATFMKSVARHGWLELAQWKPFVSSMFLHAGFAHFAGNMLFLWIFGDNVEDTLGAFRYLCFYFLCGLGAALTQFAIQPHSTVPMLGASGAIAGVLGAYAVLFPGARVVTLVPIVFFLQIIEIPAIVILGYWFVLQILSGSLTALTPTQGGTAFWAHVGGFAAGAFLILLMRPRKVAV